MPNGGSDCCGTCPFNRKNRGERGYAHARDSGPDHCDIRDLPIENAFYTYCSNHPGHNPAELRVPIGPAYRHGENGGRQVWRPAPDTPEVRTEVLRLLAGATPEPLADYPAGYSLVEAAIIHAGELADLRAVPDLDRIRQFLGYNQGVAEPTPLARDPGRSAILAAQALANILPPAEVLPFVNETVRGVAQGMANTCDVSGLPVLADALQEAGCTHSPTLDYLRSPLAPSAAARSPCWVTDVILGRVPEHPH